MLGIFSALLFAAQPPNHFVDDGALTLPAGQVARAGRDARFGRALGPRRAAWSRLEADTGTAWASWDPDTTVPSRILIKGIDVPGSMADPAVALAAAEDFLARHIDLLAPGASPSDFVVVANDLSAGMRSIGFQQEHQGLRVLGGQVSFRFKNDRLFMVGSEALPDVVISAHTVTVARADAEANARTFVEADIAGRHVATHARTGTAILPVIDRSGTITYHEVIETEVELESPRSLFTVWVDAATGAPVARRSRLSYGTSQVLFNVPERGPLGVRYNEIAPFASTSVGQTDGAANLTYNGASISVSFNGLTGPFVDVASATGPVASEAFLASDGTPLIWNAADDEQVDAQLSAFAHTSFVKAYVRNIDPNLAWLDTQIPVTVNIDDQCNANSDGNAINFYMSSESCENTGRLSDVVYHEFGHSVHAQSLIPGVGQFNTSLSEGISDYLAATIVGDTGLAPGFFYDDTPLRDFDPDGFEYRWPEDRGEVHAEGRIIGGALWDLRKLMIAKLGTAAGITYTDRLYYETTRRAVDIPSMYAEALAFDDDDGNLANGTPNGCEINAAYGPHGLFTAGEGNERVSIAHQPEGIRVDLSLVVPVHPGCPVVADPVLEWRLREDPDQSGTVEMVELPESAYQATIPPQVPGNVVQYRVRLNYSIGAEGPLPDNFVDPWYETFVGEVIPLKCLDEGWPSTVEGDGNWQIGPLPSGDTAGSDPPAGYDGGTHVYQPDLYPKWSNSTLTFDAVPTLGYTNVRLQYQRWLTVEDGFFDEAGILADGAAVWTNHTSTDEREASFHHVDKEWRFHDVDLSDFVDDGSVSVGFTHASDGGLEFGGWTIGSLCVVAFDDGAPFCGNGIVDPGEECDDGGLIDGDGCSAACTLEDDIPDPTDPTDTTAGTSASGSGGDDGGDESGDGSGGEDLDGDGLIDRGCACRGGSPVGAIWLLGLVGFLVRRRRE